MYVKILFKSCAKLYVHLVVIACICICFPSPFLGCLLAKIAIQVTSFKFKVVQLNAVVSGFPFLKLANFRNYIFKYLH